MSEIVVGYDGSDCSKAALDEAAELAKDLGEKLVIVFGYAPGGAGGGEVPAQREAVEEIGEKVTKEATDRAQGAGVETEVELVNKHSAQALADVAKERGADMIVVGTHGEAPIKGIIIGSTPHKLLHIAEVPVLVVPAR